MRGSRPKVRSRGGLRLKPRILLETDVFEGELQAALAVFIDDYNKRRDHQSIGNLTPAEVSLGAAKPS